MEKQINVKSKFVHGLKYTKTKITADYGNNLKLEEIFRSIEGIGDCYTVNGQQIWHREGNLLEEFEAGRFYYLWIKNFEDQDFPFQPITDLDRGLIIKILFFFAWLLALPLFWF